MNTFDTFSNDQLARLVGIIATVASASGQQMTLTGVENTLDSLEKIANAVKAAVVSEPQSGRPIIKIGETHLALE